MDGTALALLITSITGLVSAVFAGYVAVRSLPQIHKLVNANAAASAAHITRLEDVITDKTHEAVRVAEQTTEKAVVLAAQVAADTASAVVKAAERMHLDPPVPIAAGVATETAGAVARAVESAQAIEPPPPLPPKRSVDRGELRRPNHPSSCPCDECTAWRAENPHLV